MEKLTAYTSGWANRRFSGLWARRMPRIIMQRGVDVRPSSSTASSACGGRKCLAPIRYRGIARAKPSMVGFSRAERRLMYFFSLVRQYTPMVNTSTFMLTQKMAE